VFNQGTWEDNSEPSTDYFAPGGWQPISTGRYGLTVPRGSYIDFNLWVEGDMGVRGEVVGAHAGAQLWVHY
jgi:hypothetical protein